MQVDFRGVLRPTKTRIADDIYPRAQPLVSVHSLADCRRCLLTRARFDMPSAYTIRIQNAQMCVHSRACDHAHPLGLRTLAPHTDNMAHLLKKMLAHSPTQNSQCICFILIFLVWVHVWWSKMVMSSSDSKLWPLSSKFDSGRVQNNFNFTSALSGGGGSRLGGRRRGTGRRLGGV